MLGFRDLASREPLKAKFYDSDLWECEFETMLMPILEGYEEVVVHGHVGQAHR